MGIKFAKVLLIGSFVLSAGTVYAEKCSKDEAKAAVEEVCKWVEADGDKAIQKVQGKRFCGDNYVWLQDSTDKVKMVLHPIVRNLNDKSLVDKKDDTGLAIFVEFDKMAKAKIDGGWVDYLWKKPTDEKQTPKTSFVKMCGGALKWVAGAGVWKADLK